MGVGDESLVDALLRQHQVGVAVCDAQGHLTAFNPTLQAMLGPLTPSSKEAWADAFQMFDASGARPLDTGDIPLARALGGELVTDVPVTLRLPGQPVRHLRCTATPLKDDADNMKGAIVIVTEVTDTEGVEADADARRVRYRTRMRRVVDFASGLTTVVNHQVRSPLAVLRGHVELLQEEGPDAAASVQRALPAMQRALDALTGVVEDLSDASDMAEATNPHLEAVDLVQLVHSAVALTRTSHADRLVTVSAASETYVPTTADPQWVRRAIVALIDVVAASTTAPVTVQVCGRREAVTVTVAPDLRTDEGPPPVQVAQGCIPANPRGLGIPLADAVALAHDGQVDVIETPDGLTATLRLAREPDRPA